MLISRFKGRGSLAWRTRKWNVWVPCSIRKGTLPFGSPEVTVLVRTSDGPELAINVPVDAMMFEHRYLRHSLPLRCWPAFAQAMIELKKWGALNVAVQSKPGEDV